MDYYELRDKAYPYNYIMSSISLLICITGITLCSFVLNIIFRNKWQKLHIDLKLVTITLFLDLTEAILVLPSAVFDLLGLASWMPPKISCNANAILYILAFVTEVNFVAIVAIERYALIVHHKKLKIMHYILILIVLFSLNIASCTVAYLNNGFSVHPTAVYCLFDLYTRGGKLGISILAVSMFSCIIIIYYTYTIIMIKRRRDLLNMRELFPLKSKQIQNQANTTILKSLSLILASTITNTQYSVLTIMSLIRPEFYTTIIDTICTACILLNIVMNTLLLLGMRPDLLDELKSRFHIKLNNEFNPDATQLHTLSPESQQAIISL